MNLSFDILRQSFNTHLCNFVLKITNYMMCCFMLFCLNGQQPILTLQIIVSCHQIPPNIIYLFYSRISKIKMALHDLVCVESNIKRFMNHTELVFVTKYFY